MKKITQKIKAIFTNKPELSRILAVAGKDAENVAGPIIEQVLIMITFIVFSVIFGGLTFQIIAVGGIEAVLADLMASTCTNNAAIPCDYQTLLGAAGMALVITTSWFIYFIRAISSAEEGFNTEDPAPSRAYNDDMADILADIQSLGGVENLKALAEWKGIPYTTLRRYVLRYEKDGYVKVFSNGKGSPVRVDILS